MVYSIHKLLKGGMTYLYLKRNFRVKGKVKSDYIYLGELNPALKILNALQFRQLKNEKEISYSGEMILSRIANTVSFKPILKRFCRDEKASRIVKNITILRILFPESKRRLFLKRLKNSILKHGTDISYVDEIYRSMDKIYNNLGLILYEMVKKAVKKYKISLDQLIIDGTRMKVFTNEETDLVRFGYSSKHRRDLPQINLILAVNNQQIPFFTETYPGNENDINMFSDFINHLRHKYRFLTRKVKRKIVVFDQGNVGKATIKLINKFRNDGIYFVSLMRTNSISKYIKHADKNKMKLVYERQISKNKKTSIFGMEFREKVYGIDSNIVLCYNPDIAKKKLKTLNTKIKSVNDLVEELNRKNGESDDKLDEVKMLLKNYNFKTLFTVSKNKAEINLSMNSKNLEEREMRCGFFVLFTNDLNLIPEETIKAYKSKDVVERGFRDLKSDIEIEPFFHRKDYRRKTHAIMVIYGYFLASLLRSILKDYSFEELISIIKSGNAIEGYYDDNLLKGKKFYIFRPIKQSDELVQIFRKLRIKLPKFEIRESTPTG